MIFGIFQPPNINPRNRPLPFWFEAFNPEFKLILPDQITKLKREGQVVIINPEFFLKEFDPQLLVSIREAKTKKAFVQGDHILFWSVPSLDQTVDFKTMGPRGSECINVANRIGAIEILRDRFSIEEEILRFQVKHYLARQVNIEDLSCFYIEGLPVIGKNSVISTGVSIRGDKPLIGEGTILYPHVFIENSKIGSNCRILPGSVIRDSILEDDITLGPYTHLRGNAMIRSGAKVGNFVEMKNTVFGSRSKAMHLSYIGDTEVGEEVNVGAGTITCNYDGVKKNTTIIKDRVFIGSGTQLVAPIQINNDSYIGAGSTLTKDVPPFSLAIARGKQENKLNWVKRKRKK